MGKFKFIWVGKIGGDVFRGFWGRRDYTFKKEVLEVIFFFFGSYYCLGGMVGGSSLWD